MRRWHKYLLGGLLLTLGVFTPTITVMFDNLTAVAYADPNGTFGKSAWDLSDAGTLTIHSGELGDNANRDFWGANGSGAKGIIINKNNVKRIVIDAGVVANANSYDLFAHLNNLISIEGLDNLDTSKVTNMYQMFYGDMSLKELDLSHFNTKNVTNMSNMFGDDHSLTNLDLQSFDTSQVTDMSWMFYGTVSLKNLNVSSFNTKNVTRMDDMFYSATSLRKLDLSNFETPKLTYADEMFANNTNLTDLDIRQLDTSNVYLEYYSRDWFVLNPWRLDFDNLKTITVGPNTKFPEDASLNTPPTNGDYMGKWQYVTDLNGNSIENGQDYTADQVYDKAWENYPGTYSWKPTPSVIIKIEYVDSQGNIVSTSQIDGKVNNDIKIDAVVPDNYELVDSSPITYHINATDNVVRFPVTPKMQHDTEKRIITQTIHYLPDSLKIPDDIQTIKFSRDKVINKVTGEVKYGDWVVDDNNSNSFKAVKSPVVSGYTPNYSQIKSSVISADDKDSVINVTYKPNNSSVILPPSSVNQNQLVGDNTSSGSVQVNPNQTIDNNSAKIIVNYVDNGGHTVMNDHIDGYVSIPVIYHAKSVTGYQVIGGIVREITPTSGNYVYNIYVTPKYNKIKKKMAVIMNKGGYLYKTTSLGRSGRIYYKAGTRQQRPMFVVTKIVNSKNGLLYQVRDANAKFGNSNRKTNGKVGYIKSTKNVVPAYYSTKKVKYFKVINKKGINGYKNVSLTSKAKHYKYGTKVRVVSQKAYNLTMRYKLSNGNYISANKKLVAIYK